MTKTTIMIECVGSNKTKKREKNCYTVFIFLTDLEIRSDYFFIQEYDYIIHIYK